MSRLDWIGCLMLVPALCGAFPCLADTDPGGSGKKYAPASALIDLTARHVDPTQVNAFSRNLREAFLLDGRLNVLDEHAMYELLDGPEGSEKLSRARRLLAEAKRAFREQDFETTRNRLDQARSLHRSLNSELSRPTELADLMLYEGLVAVAQQKPDAAIVSFFQMFLLNPSIRFQRNPAVPPEAFEVIESAQQQVRQMPLRGLSPTFAAQIAERLHVAHLITGVVDANNDSSLSRATITLRIMLQGSVEPHTTVQFELRDISNGLPEAGDPIYDKIVGVTRRYLE